MRLPFAVIAAVLLLAACQKEGGPKGGPPGGAQNAPPPVTVAKPVVKDIVEQDEFTGRFDAAEFVEVRARVNGYLQSIGFRDGAVVKKGDLLFEIDPRPYQAALDQAKAGLTSASAQLDFAKGDLDRAESLRKTGNIADQLLDQRRQAFLAAQAEIARLEAGVRQAQLDLDFSQVRAPISGRIGRKLVSEGNLVAANQTMLTTIVSMDPIHFYFDVDERSFLAYTRTQQMSFDASTGAKPVEVSVALTDEKTHMHKGKLDFIDNRVDQATGTIRGRALIENGNLFITPGLFGRILIPGSAPHRGVLVPDEAIGSDQDRRIVLTVAEDGTVAAKVVRPGPKIDGYRVIREGLNGDETLVTSGLQRSRPGTKVTPKMTELPASRS